MKNIFKRYVCIKQHDIKDCGAACLATISKQYGLKIPISKIRETAGTDKQGTSALGLIKAAEKLGGKKMSWKILLSFTFIGIVFTLSAFTLNKNILLKTIILIATAIFIILDIAKFFKFKI